jgi:hypothetical protein
MNDDLEHFEIKFEELPSTRRTIRSLGRDYLARLRTIRIKPVRKPRDGNSPENRRKSN